MFLKNLNKDKRTLSSRYKLLIGIKGPLNHIDSYIAYHYVEKAAKPLIPINVTDI